MYMDDVTVMYDPEKGTNGGWVPGKKYYWPMDGFLTFAAYHPIYGIGTVSYGETGFTIDGFEVEDDPEKQIDLLFSERAYDMTSTDQKDANLYYYGVQLNFLHALSSIVFKIRADGSLVGDGTAGYEFKVKKIELLDVYDKGRFNQNLSPAEHHPSTPEASLADWICNVQSKKDYIAFDGSVTPLIVNTSEPVSTVSGDNKANLILLPQNLDHGPEKVKLRVVYDLRHKNMTEGEYVTDNVVETELTTSSVSTWLRGKRYIYTITLGLSEIRLTPKIENWVNSDAPNISI